MRFVFQSGTWVHYFLVLGFTRGTVHGAEGVTHVLKRAVACCALLVFLAGQVAGCFLCFLCSSGVWATGISDLSEKK